MNVKRYLLASFVAFVIIFLGEFLLHGLVLKADYSQLPDLLRTEAEMESRMGAMLLGYVLMALGITWIFVRGHEGRGLGEGLRFGIIIAAAFAIPTCLINWAVMPWPGMLMAKSMAGYLVEFILAGLAMAALYRPPAG